MLMVCPGWISNIARPHDWIGVGDCLGADGLRPASLQGVQACRLDTSLIFSLSPLWVPLRSSERQLWSNRYIYEFSFLDSILIHRHGQSDDKLAGSLDSSLASLWVLNWKKLCGFRPTGAAPACPITRNLLCFS